MGNLEYTLKINIKLKEPVHRGKTVEKELSLNELLPQGLAGVVDEHSFVMEELTTEGAIPVALQFSSDTHDRLPYIPPVRPLKEAPIGAFPKAFGTNLRYSCKEQGAELARNKGMFSWFLSPQESLERRFVLHFSVAQDGEFYQAPYSPFNFVVVRPDNRVSPVRQFPSVELAPHISPDYKLNTTIDQKLFSTYQYNPEFTKPYFYPVIGPSGVEITTLGKDHDPGNTHPHHKSLWIGHQSVNGVNFWEQWPGNGQIVHRGFNKLEDGPLFGCMEESNTWERAGRVYAYETRNVKTYKTGADYEMMDFIITMEPENSGMFAGDCVIGKNVWGFLAVRLKPSMIPTVGGGEITNSRGMVNEDQVIWESAEWCDISGPATAEEWNGVAIFDTPTNASFPTDWHCKNDGFICTSFSNRQDFVIRRGEKLVVKYRVYIHKGNSKQGGVAEAFSDYASDYGMTVGTPALCK